MNRIFRKGRGNLAPDATLVYPFLNPTDSTSDLPVGLFDNVSIALGEIGPEQASRVQVHPVVTMIIWVVSGDLRLKMKDAGADTPYSLELRPEEGAVVRPGTFLQLVNPGRETCRVLYVVSPPYVFLEAEGKLVYDDAVVLDDDWDALAARRWRLAALQEPARVRAKRRNAIKKLAKRKGTAKQV